MSDVLYEIAEYGSGNEEAVALVAGFGGRLGQLDQAARDLESSGRDVVVYAYNKDVLLEGDGKLVLDTTVALSRDFLDRTRDHQRRRFGGVSLGAAFAAGMEKAEPSPEPGLYAASGIDAANLVMNNRFFQAIVRVVHGVDIRRAYERRGYTLADLQEEWQRIQERPVSDFKVVLGGLDLIVRTREIMPKITAWRDTNDITVIHKPLYGHNGVIKWFGANILSVLDSETTTQTAKGLGQYALKNVLALPKNQPSPQGL